MFGASLFVRSRLLRARTGLLLGALAALVFRALRTPLRPPIGRRRLPALLGTSGDRRAGAVARLAALLPNLPQVATFAVVVLCAPLVSLVLETDAKAQGPALDERSRSVELAGQRTATSKTFRNEDGTLTTSLFTGPVHYRTPEGDWRPISSQLVATGDAEHAWRNEANSFTASFRAASSGDYLRIGVAGYSFSLAFTGAPSAPARTATGAVDGSQIAYPNVIEGVDLRYDVLPDGVKETLVLAHAGAPSRYRFVLTPPRGLAMTADRRRDGSWAFYVPTRADPVFVLERPLAFDAAESRPPHASATAGKRAALAVTRAGGEFELELSLDEAWLTSPERRFPVTLDPTITIQPDVEDASWAVNYPGNFPNVDTRLWLGADSNYQWRPGVQFDLGSIPSGAVVTDAQLRLFYDGFCFTVGSGCPATTHQFDAHRMTNPWSTSTTWTNVAFDPTVLSSFTLPLNPSNQWMSWNVTQTVTNWLSGTQPNYGFLLKRNTDALGSGGVGTPGRRFAEATLRPKLDVTYTSDAVELLAPETLHSNGAELKWTRYTGPAGAAFEKYEVHRAGNAGFTPSTSTLLATIRDVGVTSFRDTTAAPSKTFTYKVVANASASNEQTVALPADGQARKILQPGPADGKATYLYYSSAVVNCGNYGAEDKLWVGTASDKVFRPVLSFPLADIPSAAKVTSATLSLWNDFPPTVAGTVNVHRLTGSWREGSGVAQCTGDGATWYESDGGVKWTSAGGDYEATPAASVAKGTGGFGTWDDYAVTALVQKWVNGEAPNLGLLLKLADETLAAGKGFTYHSDDYTAQATLRPRLTVNYDDGSHAFGPTVAISAPAPDEKVSGTAVNVSAAASDDRRVDQVEFFAGGASIGSDATAPFSVAWNTTGATNGAHTLTAKATDDAGNVTTSARVSVTVSNYAAPTVAITSPTAGSTVKGMVSVAATASAEAGLERVEFYMDGLRIEPADTTAPYSVSWNTLDPALPAYDGSHTLTAKAYDNGGQVTTSAGVAVTVGNTSGTQYIAGFTSTAFPQSVTYDPAATTQEKYGIDVTVTNKSAVTWSRSSVFLRYRWYSADATSVVTDSANISLGSTDLGKGKSRTLRVQVEPPSLPDGVDSAQYRLRFDLYDASVPVWFGGKGNQPLENPVIVNKALKRSALGLERYYHYDGEPLGAGMTHLVNVANGNSLLHWTPFVSPGRGLSTVVELSYNSLEQKSDSPLGNNFSLAISSLTRLGLPLDVHPNKADEIAGRSNRFIEFTDGDGTTHRFVGKQAGDGTIYWEEPAGVHLYLRQYSATDTTKKWALTRPDRVTFFYDTDGYPTGVEDKNGNRLDFTLAPVSASDDPGGSKKRITTITDAAGLGATPAANRKFTLDYYSKDEAKKAQIRGKIQSISDHSGSVLALDYYEDGNLLRITQKGGTKADGAYLGDRRFVFTYTRSDGSGPAIADAGARANPDPKTANQSTRLYSVRDPRGKETVFAYCSATSCGSSQNRWKLQTRTNRAGSLTSYAYDITNRVTTMTAPLSRTTKYAYDGDGQVTKITNAKDEKTNLVWEARHLTKVYEPTLDSGIPADLKLTQYAYNDNGYLTARVDQLGNRTELAYENVAVDANDVSGKWKAGRTVPHVSQLATKTDPKGTATTTAGDFQWSFAYDAKGNVIGVTDPEAHGTQYAYNADGTLASRTDANSRTTQFPSYDANGLVTKIVDAKAETTTFGYDEDGLLRWIQDPRHAGYSGSDPREYRTYFDYDSFHRLGRQSTPKSTEHLRGTLIWSAADYDQNDNIVAEIDAHYGAQYTAVGAKTTIAYDAMDRETLISGPDSSADPDGERTQLTYDAAGRVTKVTAPKGVQTATVANDFAAEYGYDALDRVVTETRYPGEGSAAGARKTHFCYDLAGDLRRIVAPKANVASVDCAATPPAFTTTFEYDAAHRLLSETDALGHKRSRTYDANGNVEMETNENGDKTTFTYDQRDLAVKLVEPFLSGTSPRNVTTKIEYDPVGNRKRLISPRAWDASADKQTFTDYVTTYHYDAVNQLVKVELPTSGAYPEKQYVHHAYDPNGNLASSSLPVTTGDPALVGADKKTFLTYFDPGWIRTSKEPANPRVHYDYTAEGWQRSRIPETAGGDLKLSEEVRWTYYPDGLVKEHKDRGGQATTYGYDANNNLTLATDGSGLTSGKETATDVEASYDGFDQATKVRAKKQGQTNWRFTTYAYDPNGNVVERVDDGEEDGTGVVVRAGRRHTFAYDEADWVTTQLDYGTDAGSVDDRMITNSFFPTGWERERVVQRSDGAGGWQTKQTTTWDYFANGKLRTLATKNGQGTIVESHTVSYEDAAGIYVNGHRTKDVFTLLGPDTSKPCRTSACTTTYRYDPRDRLVEEKRERGGTTKVTAYTLDPAGNIVREERDGVVTTFDYVGNQLQKLTRGTHVQNYFYDADGNLDCITLGVGTKADCAAPEGGSVSAKLLADYSYDYLNRLTSFRSYKTDGTTSQKDDTASYLYDALDRVVEETESHGAASPRTTLFTYLALTNLVSQEEHKDGAGALTKTKSYGYDAYGRRIELTNKPAGGTAKTYTYGYDVHGSVSLLLKETGEAQASYGYTAYGEKDPELTKELDPDPAKPAGTETSDDDPFNPYRYSGKRYDSGSGTLDMGARRFGPDTARFLQQDLFHGALSDLSLSLDPLTQNRYSLAGGNPVSFIEWDGHMPVADGGGGGYPSPNPSRRLRSYRDAPERSSVGRAFVRSSGHHEARDESDSQQVSDASHLAYPSDAGLVEGGDTRFKERSGPFEGIPYCENGVFEAIDCVTLSPKLGVSRAVVKGIAKHLFGRTGGREAAAKAGGSLVGRSYGRVGTVVENPGIRITGFRGARDPAHGLNQVINRGVSPRVLRDTVRDPRVVLQQSGDRYLFLSDEAGVAIRSDGQVVTAYTSSQFKPHILQILRDAGASP